MASQILTVYVLEPWFKIALWDVFSIPYCCLGSVCTWYVITAYGIMHDFFLISQVVQNRNTMETLLCIAFVFEISASESGCQHSIYRLVKD